MNDYIDIYCERLAPGLWAEPLNLVSNLAFIIGAIWVWPIVRHDPGARLLTVILFLIGIGSALFHSFATGWASLADVIPIAAFVLVFIYIATVRILRWPGPNGITALILFIPFYYFVARFTQENFGELNGSVQYIPVLAALFLYGIFALFRFPNIGLGLISVGLVLAVSIAFRSLDHEVCDVLHIGVHYMWHILNACLLTGAIITLAKTPRWRPSRYLYE